MKRGDAAVLVMKKVLCADIEMDKTKYLCEMLTFDEKRKALFLVVANHLLQAFSLDAIYECTIKENDAIISCTGRIKERFCNEYGQVVKFEIKNGFYKINVKSVDK